MFLLDSRRQKAERNRLEILELMKRVYDPLLAEIKENLTALKSLEAVRKYKEPHDAIRWEDLGFSTAEWEYVKTSGYYHAIDTEIATQLHTLYSHFHEIRYWGTDVEGVFKGIRELKVEGALENLAASISNKISSLRQSAKLGQ
jgi:hypothetical protein